MKNKTVNEVSHTPTPGKMREVLVGMTHDGDVSDHTIMIALESNDDPLRAYIVRAVNCHEELLAASKNALNVLAGLVVGDLKQIRADSLTIAELRDTIARAEGK